MICAVGSAPPPYSMALRTISRRWPPLVRMPSAPGCQPASPSSALALAASNGIGLALQRRVVEHDGGQRRVGLQRRALVDGGEEGVLVDRVVDGAAHLHVVHRRLGDVEEPDARHARPRRLLDPQRGVRLESGQRLGRDGVHALRLAALQRGHARARLGDELPDHRLELGGAGCARSTAASACSPACGPSWCGPWRRTP